MSVLFELVGMWCFRLMLSAFALLVAAVFIEAVWRVRFICPKCHTDHANATRLSCAGQKGGG